MDGILFVKRYSSWAGDSRKKLQTTKESLIPMNTHYTTH